MEISKTIKYDSFLEFSEKESDLLIAIQEDSYGPITSIDGLIDELMKCDYVEEVKDSWINYKHYFRYDNKELSTIRRCYIKYDNIGDPMLDNYVSVESLTTDKDRWVNLLTSISSLDELRNTLISNYKFPEKLWK
jgi:hypothetical protein